jgi:hypothetical protein
MDLPGDQDNVGIQCRGKQACQRFKQGVAGAELKENPGVEVDDAAGELRSMMFGLGVGVVNELCTLTPSEEGVGLGGDEDTENGKADALTRMTDDGRAPRFCERKAWSV